MHGLEASCVRSNSSERLLANNTSTTTTTTTRAPSSAAAAGTSDTATMPSVAATPLSINVLCATWNVNGKQCKEDLKEWINPTGLDAKPDVYVLGFQEFDLTPESFVKIDQARLDTWVKAIEAALAPVGTYVMISQCQLVGMLVILYGTSEFCEHVSDIDTGMIGTGYMGVMGNKGAVAVRFVVGGNGQPGTGRSLCFINSHLNAHVHNVKRRQEDFQAIIQKLTFFCQHPIEIPPPTDLVAVRDMMKHEDDAGSPPEVSTSSGQLGPAEPEQLPPGDVDGLRLLDHDLVFWIGDLNYRVELTRNEIFDAIEKKDWDQMLAADQLLREKNAQRVFQGFSEKLPLFLPSYKFDAGTDQFDSSPKNRLPAYCDRILWRVSKSQELHHSHHFHGLGKKTSESRIPSLSAEEISFGAVKSLESLKESDVQVLYYDSRIQLRVSDHKPVTALLRVDLGKVVIPIDQNQKQPASVKSLPVVSKKTGYMTNMAQKHIIKAFNDYQVLAAFAVFAGFVFYCFQ